jgi:outer membrane lipoprotein-sorting protein
MAVPHQTKSMKRAITLASMVAGIASVLLSCATTPEARKPLVGQNSSPVAKSILKRMARTYASVKSYADSGVVHTYQNGVDDPASLSFSIRYLRPDHFKFEMTQNIGSPYFPETYTVMWYNGNATYYWEREHPQLVTRDDVTSTIATFTGVSSRSAHNIPSLLQKNFGWQEYLYDLASPTVLGEEVLEHVDCYRVQGVGRGERRFELWLGKSDYLIRKIKTTYPNFYTEEIHQGIAIDRPMSREMLTFSPPPAIASETHK